MWLKTYFVLMATGRTLFDAMDDPTVTVSLDDESISVSSDASSRRIQWSDVTKLATTKEHIILFAKKVAVAIIPRSALLPDAEAAIVRNSKES